LACSLTVFSLLTIGLVLLNLLQTLALSNLFSPLVWFKSFVCSFPLALSIFLLVPMLSGKMNPMRTRLAMVAQFVSHPLQAATFCLAGMLLHYLLPILNPFLDFPTEDSSLKLFLMVSGLFSGLFFYVELFLGDAVLLKYPTYRIGWPTRLSLSIRPVIEDSFRAGWDAFRIFIPLWILVIYTCSFSIWPLMSPTMHVKMFLMFFLTQSLLRSCLCLTRLIATNPRLYHVDSPLASEPSLVNLLESTNELEKLSAFQDLAIMSRYSDPRRAQVFQLSVPGGKPKTWEAVWKVSFGVLSEFNTKMEGLTKIKAAQKTPIKPKTAAEKFSTPIARMPTANGTPGQRFLWSKESSSTSSPPRNCSVGATTTLSASSVFESNPKNSKESLSERMANMADAFRLKIFKMFANFADSITRHVLSLRPVEFWIEVRPDYSTLSLISNVNCIRLAIISLSNIISAAPADDKYGVTLPALPKLYRVLSKIVKNLDRLCRNNQQRTELRKLKNEARTALGKISAAYGSSLEELNLDK